MKLYSVTLVAFFMCVFFSIIQSSVFYAQKLEQKAQEVFLCCTAKKFIAQSFKNTCTGKGFKNLDQWQLVCNELFMLDSITYVVSPEPEKLFYAKWNGSGIFARCSGEVYFINKNNEAL